MIGIWRLYQATYIWSLDFMNNLTGYDQIMWNVLHHLSTYTGTQWFETLYPSLFYTFHGYTETSWIEYPAVRPLFPYHILSAPCVLTTTDIKIHISSWFHWNSGDKNLMFDTFTPVSLLTKFSEMRTWNWCWLTFDFYINYWDNYTPENDLYSRKNLSNV